MTLKFILHSFYFKSLIERYVSLVHVATWISTHMSKVENTEKTGSNTVMYALHTSKWCGLHSRADWIYTYSDCKIIADYSQLTLPLLAGAADAEPPYCLTLTFTIFPPGPDTYVVVFMGACNTRLPSQHNLLKYQTMA